MSSPCPRADLEDDGIGTGAGRLRCPSSVEARPVVFGVTVRCRLGFMVDDPADSSDSESPESSDSDDEESWSRASAEVRCATGARWNDDVGRSWAFSKESDLDGGRSRTGDGVGEFAALRRAAISRNAATDILCEESEATLFPLGRGMTGGARDDDPAKEESGEGLSGRTCRNDLRLNDSAFTSTLREGEVSLGLDFLRSLCAHENSPPCFLGAGSSLLERLVAPSCASCAPDD